MKILQDLIPKWGKPQSVTEHNQDSTLLVTHLKHRKIENIEPFILFEADYSYKLIESLHVKIIF